MVKSWWAWAFPRRRSSLWARRLGQRNRSPAGNGKFPATGWPAIARVRPVRREFTSHPVATRYHHTQHNHQPCPRQISHALAACSPPRSHPACTFARAVACLMSLRAATDHAPLDIVSGAQTFRVHEQLATGSICTVYRCTFAASATHAEGVFKIARDACSNDLLANEAAVLRKLTALDATRRYLPFLPAVQDSFAVAEASGAPRDGQMFCVCTKRSNHHTSCTPLMRFLPHTRLAWMAGMWLGSGDVSWSSSVSPTVTTSFMALSCRCISSSNRASTSSC